MVSVATFLFLSTLGFSLAAPLGPVNVEMIRQSLTKSHGTLRGVLIGLGATSADLLIAMSVLSIGAKKVGDVLSHTLITASLFALNVLILGYIGIKAYNSPITTNISVDNTEPPRALYQQGGVGFVIVLTSPWSYLWWASFGFYILQLDDVSFATFFSRLLVVLMFLAGILAWVVLFNVALAVSKKTASPKIQYYITKLSAVLILLFALKILWDLIHLFI